MNRIRLAIADDHALVREGLCRILNEQRDMTVVAEASDGTAVVELVQEKRPHIVLLDVEMPGKDWIEVIGDITKLAAQTKVLIVTRHNDEHYAFRAFKAGARGFIVKGVKSDELVDAIRQVHDGQLYLPPKLASVFAQRYLSHEAQRKPLESLTDRQFQVMRLLALGLTNRGIAEQLSLSVKTIDAHRSHILKKLNLRNNSDITRYAMQHGLIEE